MPERKARESQNKGIEVGRYKWRMGATELQNIPPDNGILPKILIKVLESETLQPGKMRFVTHAY